MAGTTKKTSITAEELDAKLAKDGVPAVGDVWAGQIGRSADPEAEETDRSAVATLETVEPPEGADLDAFDGDHEAENADALLPDEPTYERTPDDSEPQTVQDFPKVAVKAQLQNYSVKPRSNGIGIFLQFELVGDDYGPKELALIKGADLTFDKVMLGAGAVFNGGSFRNDADGNAHTRVNFVLPQSELGRPDPRLFVLKTAMLELEPAQLTFDLTSRAK